MATRRSTKNYAKQAERDAGKELRGERIPQGAYQGQGDADIRLRGPDGEVYALGQVKNYALPQWFRDGWTQIKLATVRTGRMPLLIVVDKPRAGTRIPRKIFVCMEASDWVLWNGQGAAGVAAPSEKGPT